jgi:hypothetical protein
MMNWATWNSPRYGKPKPKPVFCKHCGQKLVQDTRITGYDEYTGEAIRPFIGDMTCPGGCGMPYSEPDDPW